MDEVKSPTDTEAVDGDERLVPLHPKWFKIGVYALMLLWMAALVLDAARWNIHQDRMFPLLVGVPLIGLLVLKLAMIQYPDTFERFVPDTSGTDGDGHDDDTGPLTRRERTKYEVAITIWVIAFPLWLYHVGFVIGFPVFVFALGYYLTRELRTALFITITFTAFIFLLFDQILGLAFWEGTLGLPNPLDLV